MSVIVQKGEVLAKEIRAEVFKIGEEIEGLAEAEEKRLVALGVVVYTKVKTVIKEVETVIENAITGGKKETKAQEKARLKAEAEEKARLKAEAEAAAREVAEGGGNPGDLKIELGDADLIGKE